MKIQCDVCEKAPATVICCADEAALCAKCDIEVHAANKLASKHQRLLIECLSNKLPACDICQEKAAFIFCVEDRALFCHDCDEPIHSASSLAANHQRFLATGIRVALSSNCTKDTEKSHLEPQPPNQNAQQTTMKTPTQQASSFTPPSWAVDDLLQFSDFESSNKKEQIDFGELEWFTDIGLFGEQVPQEALAAAEVPQLPISQSSSATSHRPTKFNMPHKKPRIEISDEDDESPDLTGLWKLTTLDLSSNQLFGNLPKLSIKLRRLSLSDNILSGHISSLGTLKHLNTLDLSENRFSGSIRRGILKLPEVTHINVSGNRFTEMELIKISSRAKLLREIDVHSNHLRGHLPVNLATYANLTAINLGHNQFSGRIPMEYGEKLGKSWRSLYLDYNFRVGCLPPQFNNSVVMIRGSLANNCLICPCAIWLCHRGQRPASECVGQNNESQ
ncbi:hypothetical protein F0562_006228 [Nyssa sinensis]|uniref:B box-type domain-containing protein n=1 Tax=Nyssa sinensis TaxID=561372 RepID=A0A5J5AMH2_9ASTE|nr:hypothetical protein F0562_006228 [Nyssa sinensis]